VVFPTQCLYGLAADAHNSRAVAEIFRIKGRPLHKPLLVLIKDQKALDTTVKGISSQARKLMMQFWPGKLTIIFFAQNNLPVMLTGKTGKIGVRLPGHFVASTLTKLVEKPITGTSANLSGMPGCFNIRDLDSKILHEVDLVLDAGPLSGGVGSTVIDVTEKKPIILREGIISSDQIFSCLNGS
jgi:L-threonylcarbamoyladenylate synthase